MKVAILGTNGFLSTAIAQYYSAKGYDLDMYGLDAPIHNIYTHFYHINLMSEKLDYSKIIQSDMIVYAIGAGIQSNLKEENNLIYNLNVTIPVSICNALKQANYKGHFVTFGSVFEMGETKIRHFFVEEEVLNSSAFTSSDYTISKRMLSRYVSSYQRDFTHWHFYIPTIYGETENPLRLIPYTINAIRNGEKLHFTTGDQIRQYIYVEEVARLLDVAYEKNLLGGLYNVQGKETLTVSDIVQLIHSVLGETIPNDCFGKVKRSDNGMKFLALDGTRLKRLIDFEPQICLEKVIRRY